MRNVAITVFSFVFIVSGAAAIIDHNSTGEDVSIKSSPQTTTYENNQNDTQYSVQVEMRDSSMNQTGNQIRNITHSERSIAFEGTITAGTPCHIIEHEINRAEEEYVLNIKTVRDELDSNQACAEVITGLNYDAEFEAQPGFTLEIKHDSETVETVTHKFEETQRMSLIQRILNFLGL